MKKLNPTQQMRVKRFWRNIFKYSRYFVALIIALAIITLFVISIKAVFTPKVAESKPVLIKMQAILTAYSSTERQTDSTPFITAYNKRVKKGLIANNCLKEGDEVYIPDLGEWFFVGDKKNSRYGCEYFDIWFEEENEAWDFGVKESVVYILNK